MDIKDKVALVSGGGSGLGAQTARALTEKGVKVAVADVNLEAATRVAEAIDGFPLSCDVTDESAIADALHKLSNELGTAQIVVNCAGIGTATRILGRDKIHPLEKFNHVIDVNLKGNFNLLRLAAEQMAMVPPDKNGERGVFIMTASIAAFEGQIGQAAYAASKGGIVSMTLPAARELAQFGVRVLTIAPGLFKTPLMDELPPDAQQSLANSIPFPKRLGDSEEFAALAIHCAENAFINGEVIRIDGGLRLAPR